MQLWEFVLLVALANVLVYSIILPIFLKGSSKHVKITMTGVFLIFLITIALMIIFPYVTVVELSINELYFFLLLTLVTVFSFVFIFLISLVVVWVHDRYL